MTAENRIVSGGRYCGAVRYRARLLGDEATECHCSQCRKQAGHRYAVAETKAGHVEIDEGAGNITWFRASAAAERGFCKVCGSHLFWRSLSDNDMAILAARIDEPTGLRMARQIFVESKGDYYDIDDDLPQYFGYEKPYPQS